MLLTYSHHANPTGARDMLQKLATFATAQGWAVDLQMNVTWEDTGGSYYDWVAGGDNYFLQIRSLGYGSQDLTYRFWIDPVDATEDIMLYHPIEAGNSVYSHSDSDNPVDQDAWKIYGGTSKRCDKMSLPHASFSDVWFVGNGKVIVVHMKVSSTHFVSFAIGTFELIPEFQNKSGSEAQCHWSGQQYDNASFKWTEIDDDYDYWWICWAYCGDRNASIYTADVVIWWNGAAGNTATYTAPNLYRLNIRIAESVTAGYSRTWFNTLPGGCAYNDWTQKWTLMRPTVYLANPKLDGTWIAAGWLPMYYLSMANLNAGDIIKFGAEEYIVFPTLHIDALYGVAYRVL